MWDRAHYFRNFYARRALRIFPLYYAFLLASSTAPDIARHPIPSLIPGSHFIENVNPEDFV